MIEKLHAFQMTRQEFIDSIEVYWIAAGKIVE